jgi:hypothetical protein
MTEDDDTTPSDGESWTSPFGIERALYPFRGTPRRRENGVGSPADADSSLGV